VRIVPAYVKISDIYRYFYAGIYFLRLDDYSVCSMEEKQALLYDNDNLGEADFLQFRECPGDTIDLFLASLNNVPLRRKFAQYKKTLAPQEYRIRFHRMVEEGELELSGEYKQFCEDGLWAFAIAWCKENGVRYTEK